MCTVLCPDICVDHFDSAKRWKFHEGSSIIRPQQTLEWWAPRTHESPRELVRQSDANVSKRFKARQLCVDEEIAISKKPPLLIAQNTQHKLGVVF